MFTLKYRINSSTAKASPGAHPAGPAPGWKTKKHKRYISKDPDLLGQLEVACQGDDRTSKITIVTTAGACSLTHVYPELDTSLILRQHFSSRTTALITPVARYLNTLIPGPTEVTQARKSGRTLRLKPFNSANFFASLKAHGNTLPFRSKNKRTEFYERSLAPHLKI